MDKLERLKKMIGYLIYTDKLSIKSTQSEIAERVNANKVSVSRALSGNEEFLTDSFLDRLNNAFGGEFNPEWVKRGEGDMLNSIEYKTSGNDSPIVGHKAKIIGNNNFSPQQSDSAGYQEIIKRYQGQLEKTLHVIDKLIDKYGQ